jgi:arylsulfate sulfotransferase
MKTFSAKTVVSIFLFQWQFLLFIAWLVFLFQPCARALTIISPPVFIPAVNAPLAGVLTVGTDVPSFVSVSVADGLTNWNLDLYDFTTNHSETVLGFYANRTNLITVSVRDQFRNTYTATQQLTFVTAALPTNLPSFTVVTNIPSQMEPGYTLFRVSNQTTGAAYITMVDNRGQIVWYAESSGVGGTIGLVPTPSDVRQLTNGNLFYPETSEVGFGEANMLGQVVRTWTAPNTYLVDSHEDLMTDHGTILYLSYAKEDVANFPSSATDPNAPTETADVSYDRVVEISETNSMLLNSWPLINMFDPTRIDYLCFLLPFYGIDPEHANAIIDEPSDGSIVVSMRNQDSIAKFSRNGSVQWILGPHENWGAEWQPYLLTPVGTNFAWNYGQHAPILTPQGTYMFFDDGNCRAEPFETIVPDSENYSRAAEFSVNETNMTVSQVWQFTGTNTDRLYCGLLGNATLLPQTGNVLITFGAVSWENGSQPALTPPTRPWCASKKSRILTIRRWFLT